MENKKTNTFLFIFLCEIPNTILFLSANEKIGIINILH